FARDGDHGRNGGIDVHMGHMFDDDILEGIIKLFIVIVIISVIFGRFAWFFIFIVIFMWGAAIW
ncbi:hypothetical protein, partial [Thermococcus peptonophilus]|uniref:hypothetical protein n=1 Tax=Thermococcus peptonophilus TaxID=53952 RepID=UPI000A9935C2